MIKRLYASNFRTLVNFELDFGPLTLLLGPNGSGKTTVFDVIRLVRDFLRGEMTTTDLFATTTLTRWQQVEVQSFEITVAGQGGEFLYHLEVEHEASRQHCRVRTEKLTFDGKPLFESQLHENRLTAQLYKDSGDPGPSVLTNWSRSTIALIEPVPENQLMSWFKERMSRVVITQFNPALAGARAEKESPTLKWNASNFVAWFRHVTSLDLELVGKLRPHLEDVVGGLVGLSLVPDGIDAKILRAQFCVGKSPDSQGSSFFCRFDELSDGQRVLLMLYTLLVAASEECTLCVDEPENFLALREINPWLNMLLDKTQTQTCQAILISHHPELIDALAVGAGRWVDRVADGHSRAQGISDDSSGLSVAELISRGWLHAQ
ncbi:MAG: AAA family ATPase [Planctomycetes bacterium]|nr:AAA family ATPase [Planctomycetota bacterium]